MKTHAEGHRSRLATVVFALLDPLPFGFFVAAFIFDVLYMRTGGILWMKAAAWLIVFGLILAIIPRLINLVSVWFVRSRTTAGARKLHFWLNLLAIVAAIVNAFVHSRDAYAVIPQGVWLSAVTVLLLCVAHIVLSLHRFDYQERGHE